MKHFVKFKPLNSTTITSVLNKKVYFSSPYDFDDFNELALISYDGNVKIPKEKIVELLKNPLKLAALIDKARNHSGKYRKEWIDKFIKSLSDNALSYKFLDDLKIDGMSPWLFLAENLAYTELGIFCMSDIEVFKTDAANLMFAHYADDLSGIGLVYEASKYYKVEYDMKMKISINANEDISLILEGDFNKDLELNNFINKSISWGYQKEYRIFDKQGLHDEEKVGLKLIEVIYTDRMKDEGQGFLDLLKKLRKDVEPVKLLPSDAYYRFSYDMSDDKEYNGVLKDILKT